MIFFSFFLIPSVIYLFEPGVASVTNAYKKMGWARLGWAATLSSETAPRWLCPKNHFPKKKVFGFVWLDHHTSHITHIQYLSSIYCT